MILLGDALETLRTLESNSVQTCVTSPPYWGLRDYGVDGQIGLEKTPEEYVDKLVKVFREVRRVLKDDGTLWLNLGDSYAGGQGRGSFKLSDKQSSNKGTHFQIGKSCKVPDGLKRKDLVGIPWAVATALRDPYYTGRIKNERDRAWIAAMIDGEGTICGFHHIRKDGSPRTGVHITITNSSTLLLDEAHRIWPASRSEHQRTGAGHLGTRTTWRWIVHGAENKMLFLREVYPYLVAKKRQAMVAYNMLLMVPEAKRVGHSSGRDAAREKRAFLVQMLSDLNHGRPVDLPSWLVEPPSLFEPGYYLRQDIIWCLSGGAWVYARTQTGDMPVMVKDLVRLNPATVKLWNGEKWTQVLGWGPSNDTSQRIELVLRSGERIGCTGGHLWPTQRGNVAARDLRVGDVIQTCRLPEPANAKRPAYLTDGLLWLIGLYLAEGSRSGDTIQLSLHVDEKDWMPMIDMAAKQVGATMTYHEEGSSLHVRLYGRILNAVLDEYIGGKTAIDKHLTTKAWMLPDDALRMIAKGYLDGDGHDDGRRIRLGFCRNYSLERDLRTLAARLGATLTLIPTTAKYQRGERPAFRGEWRWERSGHHNEKERGEIVEIRASRARQFWDIAVEDEPHLFALASGVLTHNCKPNPMPESVRDRCTKAHEYIFLLAKSARYYFDIDAIKEPAKTGWNGSKFDDPRDLLLRPNTGRKERSGNKRGVPLDGNTRNKRSVWTVSTKPFKGEHYAAFPMDLIEPCILAGSRPGDLVLDPFAGTGTTGIVCKKHGRQFLGIEINPEYREMALKRIEDWNFKTQLELEIA